MLKLETDKSKGQHNSPEWISSCRTTGRYIKHNQLLHGGLAIQPFTTLRVMISFLVHTFLRWNQCWRGKKWFSNKAYSIWEQPWVLLCLSKDSAVVKKTDSCSLSIRFCVMTLIIYLVATMTTVGEAWCIGFSQRSDDAILSNDTSSVSPGHCTGQESRLETC